MSFTKTLSLLSILFISGISYSMDSGPTASPQEAYSNKGKEAAKLYAARLYRLYKADLDYRQHTITHASALVCSEYCQWVKQRCTSKPFQMTVQQELVTAYQTKHYNDSTALACWKAFYKGFYDTLSLFTNSEQLKVLLHNNEAFSTVSSNDLYGECITLKNAIYHIDDNAVKALALLLKTSTSQSTQDASQQYAQARTLIAKLYSAQSMAQIITYLNSTNNPYELYA